MYVSGSPVASTKKRNSKRRDDQHEEKVLCTVCWKNGHTPIECRKAPLNAKSQPGGKAVLSGVESEETVCYRCVTSTSRKIGSPRLTHRPTSVCADVAPASIVWQLVRNETIPKIRPRSPPAPPARLQGMSLPHVHTINQERQRRRRRRSSNRANVCCADSPLIQQRSAGCVIDWKVRRKSQSSVNWRVD